MDPISLDSNFFDIGATSLDIAEIAIRLGQALNREIPVTDFFQRPTIRALAESLVANAGPDASSWGGSGRAQARRHALIQRSSVAQSSK
jgi:hypothetical protein